MSTKTLGLHTTDQTLHLNSVITEEVRSGGSTAAYFHNIPLHWTIVMLLLMNRISVDHYVHTLSQPFCFVPESRVWSLDSASLLLLGQAIYFP